MPCTRIARGFLALVVLAGIVAATLPAYAFEAADQNALYELPLPAYDSYGHHDYARLMGEEAAIQSLGLRFGGTWRVHDWNPWTETPRWIYGDGPLICGSVTDADQLETVTRQLIGAHPEVFGAHLENLRLESTPHVPGKWAAHYQQTHHGLDVWEAKIRVVVSDSGRLVLMGSDCFADIELDPTPALPADQAAEIATSDLPFDPATDSVEEDIDLIVLPYPVSMTETEHHLVWRVRVHTEDPVGIWVTHVDAHDGEILWRYNDVHFAYSGSVESDVQPNTYCNGVETQLGHYYDVEVDGLGTVVSDANGNWSIDGSGGARDVSARFFGPYCNVFQVYGHPLSTFNGVVQEGVPLPILFDDNIARHDERDVFDAVNDIHDFFQLFAPEFGLPNNRMFARVNISDCCNAYWDGTINFFTSCDGCANTGEIQGVVHHEFGHGVQAAILGWQGNEGLGEGNSDVLACHMTLDNIIGRGFYLGNCNLGIRNADNNLVYPDDLNGQVHHDGQIIAGFHWDAMVPLMEIYGELEGRIVSATNWHYGRILLHPTNQPAQVLATFTADDDDGNLDNGTPHWPLYAAAALHHGFDPPEITEGVLFDHIPLGDTMETEESYAVSVDVSSTDGPIDASSVKVFWRYNEGGWHEEDMAPSGMGNSYVGEIPAQQQGELEYYFYAEDTFDNAGTDPRGAPWAAYSFRIAWLVDQFEEGEGEWTVGAPGDNATTGIWELVDPIGTSAQPEDDTSSIGTHCWITGQHTPGQPDTYNDVDGGITSLTSPVYDVGGAASVTINFNYWVFTDHEPIDAWRLWISNDGGATWEFVQRVSNTTNGWRPYELEMTDFFETPGLLRLMVTAQDIGYESLMEGGIDDLVIVVLTDTGIDDGFSVTKLSGLDQNVPNPFNPRTEIRFSLSEAGPAKLMVFEANGRLVKTLAKGNLGAGEHRVVWDGTDNDGRPVSSGVYFYRLEAEDQIRSRRMVLIK